MVDIQASLQEARDRVQQANECLEPLRMSEAADLAGIAGEVKNIITALDDIDLELEGLLDGASDG